MRLRVALDAGSGAIVWPGDAEAEDAFGIPTDLARLPIPEPLRAEADALCGLYDAAFPWADSMGPFRWSAHEEQAFQARLATFTDALRRSLPSVPVAGPNP